MRQRPNKEPKFQKIEMFVGVGRSTTAPLAILNRGWFLRMGVDIAIMIRVVEDLKRGR